LTPGVVAHARLLDSQSQALNFAQSCRAMLRGR
jgi:hypothetical protein